MLSAYEVRNERWKTKTMSNECWIENLVALESASSTQPQQHIDAARSVYRNAVIIFGCKFSSNLLFYVVFARVICCLSALSMQHYEYTCFFLQIFENNANSVGDTFELNRLQFHHSKKKLCICMGDTHWVCVYVFKPLKKKTMVSVRCLRLNGRQ